MASFKNLLKVVSPKPPPPPSPNTHLCELQLFGYIYFWRKLCYTFIETIFRIFLFWEREWNNTNWRIHDIFNSNMTYLTNLSKFFLQHLQDIYFPEAPTKTCRVSIFLRKGKKQEILFVVTLRKWVTLFIIWINWTVFLFLNCWVDKCAMLRRVWFCTMLKWFSSWVIPCQITQ